MAVPSGSFESESPAEVLIDVIQELARVPKLPEIETIVPAAARRVTGADAATLIMLEGDVCDYVAESSVAPLLKDAQLPVRSDIAGRAMRDRAPLTVMDVSTDPRVDHETYADTFVRSLAIVPIRTREPIGAIGCYWRDNHVPTETELALLHSLADATSVALENLRLSRLLRVDELTQINNRRGFFERANSCFDQAAAGDGECAVAVVDVDQLERINHDHGQDAGSEILREVAAALRTVARDGDVIGRLDGDEFAFFRPASSAPADDLHREISDALAAADRPDRPYHASSSAGVVALRASSCESLDALLACAGELVNARKRAQGRRLTRSGERA